MSSIFDDENGTFLVLANAERQHCLWPAVVDVPSGWSVRHGPASRTECLDFVEAHWTDLRPASLVTALEGD